MMMTTMRKEFFKAKAMMMMMRRSCSSSPFKAQQVANTLWAYLTMGREPGVCVCGGSPVSFEVGI
jgi:hypothetical protein